MFHISRNIDSNAPSGVASKMFCVNGEPFAIGGVSQDTWATSFDDGFDTLKPCFQRTVSKINVLGGCP